MSIKVISLILIAFLARNCYKYIINYKSVDFDNNYITPMFMRKEGIDRDYDREFLTRGRLSIGNIFLELSLNGPNKRMLEENVKGRPMCFRSGDYFDYYVTE